MSYSLRSVVSALRCLCAPLSLRSVVPLLMASLSLFAISASAQTHGAFQATYSGGSVTGKVLAANGGPATCSNTPQVSPFTSSGGQYAGSATVSASTDSGGGTNQCSANIPDPNGSVPSALTATLTWQTDPANPGELPPSCAIVTQTDDASWTMSADSSSPGSGTVSNGLGGTVVPNPGGAGAVCNSTAYSVWTASGSPAPSSFPETCSPTVSFSGTSGPGYSHAGLSGSVSAAYRVSASPVFINIGGTYNPSANDYHVLTGQQITASLSGIPTGFTVTKYTWAVGGDAFKTYNEKATSNQLVALGSADLTGPAVGSTTVTPLHFYDRAKEDLTVTCTVSVTAPDGTPLSLTATSPQINVLKPTATWAVETGNVYYNRVTNAYGLYPAFGTGFTDGVYWHNALVTVPAPFSGGTCCFTQLAQPNHQYNGKGVGQYNTLNSLDNSFKYFDYSWLAGSAGTENDSPAIQTANGITIGDTLTANDTLQAWLMYQPTGGVWVPLKMYSYTWAVTLTWADPGVTWTVSGATPPPPNPGPSYTPALTNDPPLWNTILTNRE